MAFDSKKTILLEKTYLYVRASLGFQLEGTSTEKIPTNNGFYRFFVDNLQKAIGNSYVNILYDSNDLTLQCFCSDLYMDELMSSDSSAIEDVVAELKKNTTTIIEFENGVSSALESNHQDNVALNAKLEEFETGVSSAMASNHEDNVVIDTSINSFKKSLIDLNNSSHIENAAWSYPLSLLCFYHQHFCKDFRKNIVFNIDDFSIDRSLGSSVSYFIEGFFKSKLKFCSPVLSPFSYSANLKAYVNSFSGSSFSDVDISYNFDLNSDFDFTPYGGNYPEITCCFNFSSDGTKILNAFSKSKKYSLNSFDVSTKRLCLYSAIEGLGCCFNQDFCFDFNGGFLDLNFYSPLDESLLNQLKLKVITDVGSITFNLSEINLIRSPRDSSLLVCNNFPNVSINPSPSKILGIRLVS